MSKEQTTLDINTIEATVVAAPEAELVTLTDLSLALVGGGNYVVAL